MNKASDIIPAPERREARNRAWRRTIKRVAAGILAVLLLVVGGRLALPLVPLPGALFAPLEPQWEFVDRQGQPLRVISVEDAPFRRPVGYHEIPPALVQATLAAEDRRFWGHHGVDWRATLRAAWQLAAHRRVVSGGSTITQQLIKLTRPRPRTCRTKLIEALQALRLEQVWDKQHILCAYLNRLDYGSFNRGCAAAAQFYFAKPLPDLSPAECALLAGLPQAPSRLNPCKHAERARKRQQWILQQMRQDGALGSDEFARATQEPLRLSSWPRTFEAPHFIDLVLEQLGPRGSSGPVPATGWPPAELRLRTTLDLELNRFVEATIRQHLARLRPQQVGDAAAVVIENGSGDVLALVGSGDYFAPAAGQVNGAWAPRSAGSALKPFTYLLALERGDTPATVVADVPTEFATATGLFAPVNYNRRCYGPMRYRMALANSLNISAVKVLAALGGPERLQQLLRACGLSTLTRPAEAYGLGLTIGNGEARLLELANAYASLARLGEYRPYRLLLPSRAEKTPPRPSSRRVAAATAAYLIADILSDNAARTPAFGAESALRFDFPVACKTGTSSDFRDNWAFGYTPEFTVGVWVGNFDGAPMQQVSGVTGAAPIMHEILERLHRLHGTTWYSAPENLVECSIDPITGKRLESPDDAQRARGAGLQPAIEGLPGMDALAPVREKFLASALPPLASPADYDAAGRVILGAEYREWLAGADNWLAGRAVAQRTGTALRITFPLPGTTFYLDPDLPGEGRRVTLRAEGAGALAWHSETLPFAQENGRQLALLTEGHHEISVYDPATGARAQTWIEVVAR